MVTTHLTDLEAEKLTLPDLIRRVRAGEEIHIEDGTHTAVILKPASVPLDNSIDATIERLEQWEREHGEPLRLGSDFADDLEQIIALRRPRDTSVWD
jgi:antitoxin (DNA-binding transcriptional repressor) of toxin-antitoxin stability system